MADTAEVTAVSIAAARAALAADGPVTVHETHMSVVLIAGERVLKIRRAVRFSFADHTSPEARRASAGSEVALNAALAPGIYVAVHGVAAAPEPHLVAPDAADAADWVVEMRRFDEERTLSALIAAGEADARLAPGIEAVAARLAAFHDAAAVSPDAPADPVSAASHRIALGWTEVREVQELASEQSVGLRVHEIGRRLEAAALALADEIAARGRDGLVRDGHGDVRAEHVLLLEDGTVLVVDRLEYRADLRTVDVADDLSFLVMDLIALRRPQLADTLARAYADAGGRVCSHALLSLYGARRALVRAKVDLLRAAQDGEDAGAVRERAERLVGTARRLAWQTHGPLVIVLCGVSGSGKSHLAAALGDVAGIPVFSSDRVRKQLLGLAPTDRAGEEAYTAEVTERVYRRLGELAAAQVAQGRPAIVDATCLRRHERAPLLEAVGGHAVFAECVAPDAVIDARVAARASDPDAVSDAGAAVLARQRELREPLDELGPGRHLTVRTDRPVAECVAGLEVALDGDA